MVLLYWFSFLKPGAGQEPAMTHVEQRQGRQGQIWRGTEELPWPRALAKHLQGALQGA